MVLEILTVNLCDVVDSEEAFIMCNRTVRIFIVTDFCRAMHFSAKRGLAIAYRPPVCL